MLKSRRSGVTALSTTLIIVFVVWSNYLFLGSPSKWTARVVQYSARSSTPAASLNAYFQDGGRPRQESQTETAAAESGRITERFSGGDRSDKYNGREREEEDALSIMPQLILGLSHHKTGTYQMSCLLNQMAMKAGLDEPTEECLKDNGAAEADLTACQDRAQSSGMYPAIFKTYHGFRHTCSHNKTRYTPCVSFMLYRECKEEEVVNLLQTGSACEIDLPAWVRSMGEHSPLAALHFIRNPIDSVISAYLFHVSGPKSEPWLFKPRTLGRYISELSWLGVRDETLLSLGFPTKMTFPGALPDEREEISFIELLQKLKFEKGVILQFWHSLPELLSMVRQSKSLMAQLSSRAVELRFEDLKYNFNDTFLNAMRQVNKKGIRNVTPNELLDAVVLGNCDPGTWTQQQLQKSSHVTTGKSNMTAVERVLLEYPPSRNILCALCEALGYIDDSRCAKESSLHQTHPQCSYDNLSLCL